MFGRLLGWYTIFWELLSPNGLLPAASSLYVQILRSPILQRYCTALEQRPSAKLCGVVQGMELQNFRRGRHLYSAGRPSRCYCSFSVDIYCNTMRIVMGGYSHLFPSGQFPRFILVGIVCTCIMLCCVARSWLAACITCVVPVLYVVLAAQKRHVITCSTKQSSPRDM